VDDDLIALAGGTGVDSLVQRGFGQQGEGVRLLLLHRRSLRHGWGHAVRARGSTAPLLVELLARRGEGLHEEGADFGRPPALDPDHTVIVLIHV